MLLVKVNISERVEGIDEESKEILEVVSQAKFESVLVLRASWNSSCFQARL